MGKRNEKRLLNEILPDPNLADGTGEGKPRQRTMNHLRRILSAGLVLPIAACVNQSGVSPPRPQPPKPEPAPGGYQVVDALPPPVRLEAPGFLALNSTPVAEIEIDGKPTSLKTPQDNIKLTPGPHTIKLSAGDLHQTFSVEITSGTKLSLNRDLRAESRSK